MLADLAHCWPIGGAVDKLVGLQLEFKGWCHVLWCALGFLGNGR